MKKKQTALLTAGLLVLGGTITVAAQAMPEKPQTQDAIYSTVMKDKEEIESQGITIDFVRDEKKSADKDSEVSGDDRQELNDSRTAVKRAVCPAAEVPAK